MMIEEIAIDTNHPNCANCGAFLVEDSFECDICGKELCSSCACVCSNCRLSACEECSEPTEGDCFVCSRCLLQSLGEPE